MSWGFKVLHQPHKLDPHRGILFAYRGTHIRWILMEEPLLSIERLHMLDPHGGVLVSYRGY